MRHAEACAALTEQIRDQLEPFDIAYSLEALARAHAVAGNAAGARPLRERAIEAAQALADGPTRQLTLNDIEGGNWGTLERSGETGSEVCSPSRCLARVSRSAGRGSAVRR